MTYQDSIPAKYAHRSHLTPRELAECFDGLLSAATIRNGIRQEHIRAIRPSERKYLIPMIEVKRLLSSSVE